MFGRCIYLILSLIYQTNQKTKNYDNDYKSYRIRNKST